MMMASFLYLVSALCMAGAGLALFALEPVDAEKIGLALLLLLVGIMYFKEARVEQSNPVE